MDTDHYKIYNNCNMKMNLKWRTHHNVTEFQRNQHVSVCISKFIRKINHRAMLKIHHTLVEIPIWPELFSLQTFCTSQQIIHKLQWRNFHDVNHKQTLKCSYVHKYFDTFYQYTNAYCIVSWEQSVSSASVARSVLHWEMCTGHSVMHKK